MMENVLNVASRCLSPACALVMLVVFLVENKKPEKKKHTLVPVPKSNYVYAHTAEDVLSPYSHKGNR